MLSADPPGFGLGLRTPHYPDFLAGPQPVDWLEVITDNFLGEGGKPLALLERFRADYPLTLHGVAMGLGAADGLDRAYLQRVKRLADRVQPLWVSEHLCWTGQPGRVLHDLYPLPFSEASGRLLARQIRQAQDMLERRLLIENVSSYLQFAGDGLHEWDFLAWLADEADCELLVDLNNVYVSSVNHGFDPLSYLRALPAQRVRQIHLAGHSVTEGGLIDTHDHPICEPVWALYREARQRWGAVSTLIERDDHIPPLPELLLELDRARSVAAQAGPAQALEAPAPHRPSNQGGDGTAALLNLQKDFCELLLQPELPAQALAGVLEGGPLPARRGLAIYHHAYRARLREVLADSFALTRAYAGDALFDDWALAHAEQSPPDSRSLAGYGEGFADLLARRHPANPELHELAALEWALRSRFDGADHEAWCPESVAAEGVEVCFSQWPVLHPSLCWLSLHSNATSLWRALKDEAEVPLPQRALVAQTVVVWRQDWQPSFLSLERDEAQLLRQLQTHSLADACEQLAAQGQLRDQQRLGAWLQRWWQQGLLARAQLS